MEVRFKASYSVACLAANPSTPKAIYGLVSNGKIENQRVGGVEQCETHCFEIGYDGFRLSPLPKRDEVCNTVTHIL